MVDLGKRIRKARSKKRWTQAQLAQALSVTQQTVADYEADRAEPDFAMLLKIAETLGTDLTTLMQSTAAEEKSRQRRGLAVSAGLLAGLLALEVICLPLAEGAHQSLCLLAPMTMIHLLLEPLIFLTAGFAAMSGMNLLVPLGEGLVPPAWFAPVRKGMVLLLLLEAVILLPVVLNLLAAMLHAATGLLSEPVPFQASLYTHLCWPFLLLNTRAAWVYFVYGALLRFFGFPGKRL